MPDVGPIELIFIALTVVVPIGSLILTVLGVVWLIERRSKGHALPAAPASGDPALAALRERYARGEIDATEFEERKRTLGG